MDSLTCEIARHLRVADADIVSLKPHDEGYEVVLVDGTHLLVTKHGDYLLSDEGAKRHLPHWKKPKPPKEEKPPKEDKPEKELHVPHGTSDAVLAWAGDRVDRAEAALVAERERPKPRLALIKQLERIVGDGEQG